MSTSIVLHRCRRIARTWLALCLMISSCMVLLSGCMLPLRGNGTANVAQISWQFSAAAQAEHIRHLVQSMSLPQKLGQLIMVEYIGNSYIDSGLQKMVTQQFIGGLLYQPVNRNFDAPDDSVANAAAFTAQFQKAAQTPLFVAIDQEGGQVSKLQPFFGPSLSAAALAASGNPEIARQRGALDAQHMKQLGINVDLAPVVDVQTVEAPLLQDRLFSSDPQIVSKYAGAFLDGLQQQKVVGTLKHFPGLGSLTAGQDPHKALFSLQRSVADLRKVDWVPYKQLIPQKHPGMIMATDVLVPEIDPVYPAELSPRVINGTLRNELGYQGVVITDGLYLKGITSRWTIPQAAVLAIQAGVDIVEGPYTSQQVTDVLNALTAANQQGTLSTARIDEAVQRILSLKMQYGIVK